MVQDQPAKANISLTTLAPARGSSPVSAGPGYVPAPELDGMGADMLAPGVCATVAQIDAPDADMDRLKAMGVCVGRRIEVIQRGDPMIVRVLGSRLGVSRRLAKRIVVTACIAPQCTRHP